MALAAAAFMGVACCMAATGRDAATEARIDSLMARMTLQSLLKQAGDAVPEAAIKQLNAALQQFKKV